MKTCKSCGHKDAPLKDVWCFVRKTKPLNGTCIMWTQSNKKEMDLPEDFKDIFGDFFKKSHE